MTEPSPERPVPGPPRPGPGPGAVDVPTPPSQEGAGGAPAGPGIDDLDERPVSEHVAVFEAEHERLRRELGTIDQL